MRLHRIGQLLILLGLITTAGCTFYKALTPPPPGRVAHLNRMDGTIRISRGVALGFECVSSWDNTPCSKDQATVDDTNVAQVYPAYLGKLKRYITGSHAPTSYVLVGLTAGQTVLRIPEEDPITVTVEE